MNTPYVEKVQTGQILTPATHVQLRQTCLGWALEVREKPEPWRETVERAQGFLDFMMAPLKDGVPEAMAERPPGPAN